jgi:hypothetical protein
MKALAFAAALALAPAMVSAADLSGVWKLNLDIQGMPIPLTCTFAQMDKALSGTCDGADGKPAALTGSVDGGKLAWTYDTVFQGMPMHVAYTGEVKADNSISGAVEGTGGASGTFTGTK